MVRKKSIREKGKVSFSKYFQKFDEGDRVSVVRELSVNSNFPDRLQGKTGVIESKRGKAYFVRVKDQNREKSYLIEPIHLRKIKALEKNDKQ